MPVFVIFIKARIVKKHKCLLQMNRQRKLNKLHLIECYKTLKMETTLSFKNIQKNPDGLMLAKTGQRQSNQWCMILHTAPQKAGHREIEKRKGVISPWGRDGENAKMLVKGINFLKQNEFWRANVKRGGFDGYCIACLKEAEVTPRKCAFFLYSLPLRVFRHTHRYTCVLLGRRSFFHWFSDIYIGTRVCYWGDKASFTGFQIYT